MSQQGPTGTQMWPPLCCRSASCGPCVALFVFSAGGDELGSLASQRAFYCWTHVRICGASHFILFPRRLAPSSVPMRGVSIIPWTRLEGPRRMLSPSLRFPCTDPSMTISRASMSAWTRPLEPTVTRVPLTRILPCAPSSMRKPEILGSSPRLSVLSRWSRGSGQPSPRTSLEMRRMSPSSPALGSPAFRPNPQQACSRLLKSSLPLWVSST